MQPHDHQHVLGVLKNSTQADARAAIAAAQDAAPGWRGAVLRRPRRDPAQGRRPARRSVAPAAQRRHDARPVEDRLPGRDRRGLRADRLLALQRALRPADPRRAADREQPAASGTAPTTGRSRASSTRSRRSTSPRSPATCRPRPALMGNTVIWKPSPTQQVAAHLTMELLEEAGHAARRHQHAARRRPRRLRGRAQPPGPRRHPLHRLHADLPAPVGRRSARTSRSTAPTRASSARPAARTSSSRTRRPTPTCCASRCCAAPSSSRARSARPPRGPTSPRSVWNKMKDSFLAEVESITMGDVTDFSNFMGAVIDDRGVRQAQEGDRAGEALEEPRRSSPAARSTTRSATSCGRPSSRAATRPTRCSPPSTSARSSPCTSTTTRDFEKVVAQMESFAPYALTGAIIAQDRSVDRLGAARRCASRPATSTSTTSRPARSSASSRSAAPAPRGTNDKAGARSNLMRWTSPRSIKETFDPPKDYRYPYMG